MSRVIKRVLCHAHKESTPSLVVYDSGVGHCYGCGWHGKMDGITAVEKEREYVPVEDVRATVKKIRELGLVHHRGLDFHSDGTYFYVVWPGADYYKRRPLSDDFKGPKYLGPAGVPKPLFEARRNFPQAKTLVVIEGEINALSIANCFHEVDVVSPGSASDFESPRSWERDYGHYRGYQKIVLIADEDKAGAKGCIKLMALMRKALSSELSIYLMKRDANEIMVKDGCEALREELKEVLGL